MKTYTIVKKTPHYNTHTFSGTIPHLVSSYAFLLNEAKLREHAQGNKKINTNPKTIKGLIANLNKAAHNCFDIGFEGIRYTAE